MRYLVYKKKSLRRFSIKCFLLLLIYAIFVSTAVAEQEPENKDWLSSNWGLKKIIEQKKIEAPKIPQGTFCQQENFDLFIALFAEDIDFQFSRTAFPLEISVTEPSEDRSLVVTTDYFSKVQNINNFGLFPNRQQRMQCGFWLSTKTEGSSYIVTLIPDYGLSIRYQFEWDKCWYLKKIDIYSF